MTAAEMRSKRATLIKQAQTSWTEAEARDGGPTAEDQQTFDATMAEVDRLEAAATKAERRERIDRAAQDLDRPLERRSRDLETDRTGRSDTPPTDAEQREAFRHYLMTGGVRGTIARDQARIGEYRDTIIGTDAKGGFLITPTAISEDIVQLIDDEVFIRELCRASGSITTVTDAKKLGIRKRVTRMSDANWTTEVAAVTEDTAGAYGRRDLEPYLLSKLAKVSLKTLALAMDAETELTGELSYKFGVSEEKAYLTGDGSNKPLGIFVADANGISTARDVAAASATVVTGDDLINVKYSLKQNYLRGPSIAWVVSREFAKRARKLKVASTTGGNDLEYVWSPGLSGSDPDTLLGMPMKISEMAPNTFTTGLYVAVLGNFRYYRIAELNVMFMQRLVELYAGTNEVGLIGRRFVDGAPIQEEAFGRLKMA